MNYETWRATFQSSEQAARTAFREWQAARSERVVAWIDEDELEALRDGSIASVRPEEDGLASIPLHIARPVPSVTDQESQDFPVWPACPECGSLMTEADPANPTCDVFWCGECGFNEPNEDSGKSCEMSESWNVRFALIDGGFTFTRIRRKGNPLPLEEVQEWADAQVRSERSYAGVDEIYPVEGVE